MGLGSHRHDMGGGASIYQGSAFLANPYHVIEGQDYAPSWSSRLYSVGSGPPSLFHNFGRAFTGPLGHAWTSPQLEQWAILVDQSNTRRYAMGVCFGLRRRVATVPMAEFAYNNSYQASIGMAPFEVLYGSVMPRGRNCDPGSPTDPPPIRETLHKRSV